MSFIKEKLPVIMASIAFIILCVLAFYILENYKGYYYVKVDNKYVTELDNKSDMKYEYKIDCYNAKGRKRKLTFKTSKELRSDAYIKLEVLTTGVHSWEEIDYESLPNKVKTKYRE